MRGSLRRRLWWLGASFAMAAGLMAGIIAGFATGSHSPQGDDHPAYSSQAGDSDDLFVAIKWGSNKGGGKGGR